ncbi:MAG: DNA cytosine methyltransferase [Proteobacteria bacterium]|nr:MAG: DNA cytosine methyltransferase [Pseudomonadota bacterium]
MGIRVYDFFCGCGGTSAGFQAAGMEIVLGLDMDTDSRRTFLMNFPQAKFVSRKIEHFRAESLTRRVGSRRAHPTDITLFSGCAPCQPFSQQNKNRDGATKGQDDRFALLGEFGRFVSYHEPQLVFVENVPGMQRVTEQDGPFFRFLNLLRRLGYWFDYDVVNALDYGVPQRRRRLVLIASKLGPIKIPQPTHGPGRHVPQYSTVAEWIAGLPPLEPGQDDLLLPNHRAANLTTINRQRLLQTPAGGSRADWPDDLVLNCHRDGHTGHTDVYGRMSWNRHSSALTTKCTSISNGRFGHPVENRAISVREAARLQTFDMNFRFYGGLNSTSRQIGNAVPVRMARCFGEAFVSHIELWYRGELARG